MSKEEASTGGVAAEAEDAPVAPAGAGEGAAASETVVRRPVVIPDDFGFDADLFRVPHHYRKYVDKIVLPHGMIKDRTARLAQDIREDYGKAVPHLLCVLKGAHAFFHNLCKELNRHHEHSPEETPAFTFDFIRVKSYEGTESTGNVKIFGINDFSVFKDRDLLVVEDIIDTGLTMTKLVPYLMEHGARSVKVCTLLQKRTTRSVGFKGDYVGFDVPDAFLVGYNMDFNEIFRDMRHLGVLNKAGFEAFKGLE